MQERSLRQRLATMSPDELRRAMEATALGDRTHAAHLWQRVLNQREHAEVFESMTEELLPMVEGR